MTDTTIGKDNKKFSTIIEGNYGIFYTIDAWLDNLEVFDEYMSVDVTKLYRDSLNHTKIKQFMSSPVALEKNKSVLASSFKVDKIDTEVLNKFRILYRIIFHPSTYKQVYDVNTFIPTGQEYWGEEYYIIRGVLND